MRFLIAGMTCEGCAKSVRRVIEKISGVGGAEISLEKNMAQVTTLTTVQPEEIIQAVRNAGYDAKQA